MTNGNLRILEEIKSYNRNLEGLFKQILCNLSPLIELEITFKHIRTRQSAFLNLINKLLKEYIQCKHRVCIDAALFNCGTYRIDSNIKGVLTYGDIFSMLPYEDNLLIVKVSGSTLKKMLDNSVSQLPSYSGRYLNTVGVK